MPYDEGQIKAILKAIGGDFSKLTTTSASSTISYSRDAVQVINYLVANGFVKSCIRKDDKIVVVKH